MRIAILAAALRAARATAQASAQSYGVPRRPQARRDRDQGLPADPQDQDRRPAHLRHPPVARAAPPGDGAPVPARQRGRLLRRQRHAHGRELLRLHRQRPRRLRHAGRPALLRRARLQSAHGPAQQHDPAARRARRADQRADPAHHAHALCDGRRQGAVGGERIVRHPGRQGTECRRGDHQPHLRQRRQEPASATPAARFSPIDREEIVSCRVWLRST